MQIDFLQLILGAIGAAGTIVGVALKILFNIKREIEERIEQLDDRLSLMIPREEFGRHNSEVWSAMEQRRQEMDKWRSEVDRAMVTKEDLRAMELRLVGVIRGNGGMQK